MLLLFSIVSRCGPGTWLLEVRDKYQKSEFIGVDANPSFPTIIKPDNVTFSKVNILDNGLPFKSNCFDFVHMRFMMLAFNREEWKSVIQELIRVCKPGGWIEIMEG